MKTDDLLQWALIALVGYLAYKKFATPAAQPVDPYFGVKDPTGNWD